MVLLFHTINTYDYLKARHNNIKIEYINKPNISIRSNENIIFIEKTCVIIFAHEHYVAFLFLFIYYLFPKILYPIYYSVSIFEIHEL